MNAITIVDTLPQHQQAAQHETLQAALAPEVRERLSHLFRATLKEGRIHPLYLPVLHYRSTLNTSDGRNAS